VVRADAQALALEKLDQQLSDAERDLVRRGIWEGKLAPELVVRPS
jgi:23S rRNA maturation mini-RNase III